MRGVKGGRSLRERWGIDYTRKIDDKVQIVRYVFIYITFT